MADRTTRTLERERADSIEAQVALLRGRVRSGELSERYVGLASYLGHPVASLVAEPLDPKPGDWRYPAARVLAHGGLQRVDLVRLACDLGERSLVRAGENRGVCEAAYAAARAWADCPCEGHRRLAEEAAAAAAAAGETVWAKAEAEAVWAAVWAAGAAVWAAGAAEAAARAAVWAAGAEAAAAEREWQAAYLADWLVTRGR